MKEVTVVGYRGDLAQTDIGKFDRDLVFFTKDSNVAKTFGKHITKAKITFTNPFTIKNADSWGDVPVGEIFDADTVFDIVKFAFGPDTYTSLEDYYEGENEREPISIDVVAKYLNKNTNYDGIIAHNIDEGPLRLRTTIYIVFINKNHNGIHEI